MCANYTPFRIVKWLLLRMFQCYFFPDFAGWVLRKKCHHFEIPLLVVSGNFEKLRTL